LSGSEALWKTFRRNIGVPGSSSSENWKEQVRGLCPATKIRMSFPVFYISSNPQRGKDRYSKHMGKGQQAA